MCAGWYRWHVKHSAHHPAGPMVSALTRALSVSFRSSSTARLTGQVKKKNESREGEESRGQRWHKTPRGSQGENNLIKWEKTECKGESESLVSDWGTAAVSSFDPSCWISSAEETHWFSRPLTTQHRQLVVADIRWQGFLTATTHSHSSYNTINTTAVLQKYPYWWRRLRGFKGKLANNSCKRELTTQIVTYFSSSLSSAIAS